MRSKPESSPSQRGFAFLTWALGLLLAGTLIGAVLLATALSASASPLRVDPTFNACGCLVETPAGVPRGSFPTPDDSEIAELAERLRKMNRILVTGAGEEKIYVTGPRVDQDGLRFRALTVRQGFGYRTIEQHRVDRGLLPWSDIGTIRISQGKTRQGALIGAGLGLLLGIAIASNQPCNPGFIPFGARSNCPSVKMGPILGGFLGGAATGAIIGSRADRWRNIYP